MRIKYFVESNTAAFSRTSTLIPLYYQFYWFICFSHRIHPTKHLTNNTLIHLNSTTTNEENDDDHDDDHDHDDDDVDAFDRVRIQVFCRHRRWFSFHCCLPCIAFECGMFGYCCVSLLNACLTTRQTGSSRLPHYHSSQHPLFPDMTHCVHRLALFVAAIVVVRAILFFSHFYQSPVVFLSLTPFLCLSRSTSRSCRSLHNFIYACM